MLVIDQPDHTRMRKPVTAAFTPRVIARLRDRIDTVTEELPRGPARRRAHRSGGAIRGAGAHSDHFRDAGLPGLRPRDVPPLDDIAAVAATALLGDEHVGKSYSLAGPEILTRTELIRQLGRGIPFIPVSRDEAVEVFRIEMGDTASWYVDNVLGGMAEHPVLLRLVRSRRSSTVPRRPFARWTADHVRDFAEAAT
ncbi:hypothetical protein GFY24_38585 [Nocardia sp. SYP-A9097]|uniref:hypothetical protein n=1 Tax=Nocardia sp. SYP-A9097 TaxID=2663237 RepID=UPI00129AFA01|nr:hypothetical protein [Nocardia sp. SYP-A9097]MRH93260.1 hypothetical protein [Nocardia sp. SYP-A9097]